MHALGIVQIFTFGTTLYLLSVLAEPIAADTGWPATWVVGALSIAMLVAGLLSPRVGDAIGKHGGRQVLALGCTALAAGLSMIGLAPVLTVYLLGWAVVGVGMAAALYDAAFATLGKIYGRNARVKITVLTLWGGLASTVMWPLSALLVENIGWRGTCLCYAGLLLAVCVPLVLWQVPAVRLTGAAPQQDAGAQVRLTGPERTQFTLITLIQVNAGLFATIIAVQLLVLLQARGLTLGEAVAIGALVGPAQVGGRLLEMAGLGRFHPLWSLAAAVLLCAAGLGLLASGVPVAGIAVIIYGAGNGILSIARGSLPLALFGPERYAPLMGRIARPALAAQAVAPPLGALLITHFGAGGALFAITVVATVNVGLLVALFRARAAASAS